MKRMLSLRPLVAFALLAVAGCSMGGGGGSIYDFTPGAPISIAPFGQQPITTSATARFVVPHGTTTSFHITEGLYTGVYASSTVTSPAGSTCIAVQPKTTNYVFAVATSTAASCTYPQTADITFTDGYGTSATLYVEVT
jgi:hypothetical protein